MFHITLSRTSRHRRFPGRRVLTLSHMRLSSGSPHHVETSRLSGQICPLVEPGCLVFRRRQRHRNVSGICRLAVDELRCHAAFVDPLHVWEKPPLAATLKFCTGIECIWLRTDQTFVESGDEKLRTITATCAADVRTSDERRFESVTARPRAVRYLRPERLRSLRHGSRVLEVLLPERFRQFTNRPESPSHG